MRFNRVGAVGVLGVLVFSADASAINIVFDYSLDTNNFFDTQAKRDLLDAAAAKFEVFTDTLDAIVPGTVYNAGTQYEFSDTWDATFTHPGTGAAHVITDLTIPADTLIIYAGGRNLSGTTLGVGGPGGFNANGIVSFVDTVQGRGEAGALLSTPTDFAPWGGAISFDMPNDWSYDGTPGGSESDFFSVAVHELGHALGFGTADSFDALVSGTSFTGAAATALYGGNPPLDLDQSHWAEDTSSYIPDGGPQEASMDPNITDGTVKQFTLLDFAAMDDLGWDVPAMSPGGLTGDLNGDGFVGIDDLNIVLSAWNQFAPPANAQADPSGDGYVGIDDLNTVLSNWNAGTPPTAAAVPEPGTLAVLSLGVFGTLRRR